MVTRQTVAMGKCYRDTSYVMPQVPRPFQKFSTGFYGWHLMMGISSPTQQNSQQSGHTSPPSNDTSSQHLGHPSPHTMTHPPSTSVTHPPIQWHILPAPRSPIKRLTLMIEYTCPLSSNHCYLVVYKRS